MTQVAERLQWIPTTGATYAPSFALMVPEDRVEQEVQKRMEEKIEDSRNRIIKTANYIMDLLYKETRDKFNKIIKEIDGVWIYSNPMDFTFCVYCITKDINGDSSLEIRKIESFLHEKFPYVCINVEEALKGNEDLVPSHYQKVYPAH